MTYLNEKRDINNSTFPNFKKIVKGLSHNNYSSLDISLLHAVFGDNYNDLPSGNTVLSFGQSKDGFYTKTDYLLW